MTEKSLTGKEKSNEYIMDAVNKSYSSYAKKIVDKKTVDNKQSISCCEPVETPVQSADCCESSEVTNVQLSDNIIQTGTIPTLGCDQNAKGGLLGIAQPRLGDVVVDLGSGPGRDAIITAKLVGPKGKVIGIDFSDDMLALARQHADEQQISNVDFRKGNLLKLPVEDNTADLIISNCVINLVPDKLEVFKEAFRILKLGGRIIESDMVGLVPIDEEIEVEESMYCGCIGGAVSEEKYLQEMRDAGFKEVKVQRLSVSQVNIGGKQIPYASSIFFGYKK